MYLSNLKLAWHFYQQEKHLSHQRFMGWTQAVLMVFIVTLSQTSQSIQDYLSSNLANLLGADLVISQKHSLNEDQHSELTNMSEQMVLTQTVVTTITHKDKWQRTKLKAVGSGYPLEGELRTAVSLDQAAESSVTGPQQGEIWLDSRLLASLSLAVGDTIAIANQVFSVTRILLHEPDRLMEGHNVDMRAMIHSDDLGGLRFPQDIINHRYLFAADTQQTNNILEWQKTNLPAAQVHHKQGAHPLALFWKRTENFIGLASIILFFMAAIAIEQLTRVQMQKEQFFTAVCMSLGATKITGIQISIMKWIFRLLMMLPAVLFVSALCHWLLVDWLTSTFNELTWQWQMGLALQSVISIAAIFLVFQVPVWAGLKQSSVAQLVSNTQHKMSYWISVCSAIAVLASVAFAYSDNGLLTAMVLLSMLICVVLILVTSWAGLSLGEKISQRFSGLMPFALFMMKQRLVSKSTQILGVGLCAFLLLFTLMLMRDLGSTMSAYQRQHDGNLMVSQATKEQMQNIQVWAAQHDIQIRQSKPYVYAKLTQVNGQFLSDYTDKPSDSMATFKRSIRLHWTDRVPNNNRVVDGQWWQADTAQWQQISMEQEVMTDLGLSIGDALTFFIGSQSLEFTIVASHAYKPGAGSITFWVQMPSSALANIQAPHYSMASLELAEDQFSLLSALWQQHPSLRMVSLKELTANFDAMLSMITQVISGFSILIIILASIVIISSINALEGKEKKKNAIIMSFGFDKSTCLKLNIIEWIVTGSIAAIGSITATYVAGLLIYQSQFSLSYQPDFLWLSGTLLIILVSVALLGISASKNSLSSSVRELMTE